MSSMKSGNTALQSASASALPSDISGSGTTKTIMLGRFRIVALVGEGAMGKVMRAEDTKLKRHVALKCLKKRKGDSTNHDEQFIREARSAATLDHPAIVQIYEIGEGGGYHYIAMELIEGGNLGTMLKACGPLDVTRACQLCAEAADGLAYAAKMGVTHRDIKPENLMLTRAGRCKITDFGLARIEDPSDSFSMPVGAIGTPAYMAPEVVTGQPATDKSDVYSLGAVLYRLLTGKPPFPAKDRREAMRLQVEAAVPDVRALAPTVPESLAKVIMRALAKNPDERPNAQTFAAQLRAHTISPESSQIVANASGAFASVAPRATPASKWTLIGSFAVGTVAAIAVVAIAMVMMNRHSAETPISTPPTSLIVAAPVVEEKTVIAASPAPAIVQTPAVVPLAPPSVAVPSPIIFTPTTSTPLATTPKTISGTVHSTELDVSDVAQIILAAQDHKSISLTGKISSFSLDSSAKVVTLGWEGNPQLTVTYPTRLFGAMTKRFGGKDGSGIQGQKVTLTATPTLVGAAPTIVLTSSTQLQLAK